MPVPSGTRFRYKKGTNMRLGFKDGEVVEAKNMETGKTHTWSEFKADKKKGKGKGGTSAKSQARALREKE